MADRRFLLRGLAALPLAGLVPATALAEAPEPIVGLLGRALVLRAEIDHPDTTDERSDAAYDEMSDLVHLAVDTPVTTMAGALAALGWARGEFAAYHLDKPEPDYLDEITLRFMDGAFGVLRQAVEGGARG